MDWMDIPETLKTIKGDKEAGTSCFVVEVYSYDRFPFIQEGIFYFRRWYSVEEIIIKWLCLNHDIVMLFSAKDNIKFPNIEMERKFKDLIGSNVEFNPDDKYSRLSMGGKLFELPKDTVESCYAISKAIARQGLRIAIVIQRAEILLPDASIDYRLLDSIKSWITVTNNHTLLLLTDNEQNIHHDIRHINSPLLKHLKWNPPTKVDFERLFTNLQSIKPYLFNECDIGQLASACEGLYYLELERLLNKLEKEKAVLSVELLKHISDDAKKHRVKCSVGEFIIEKPEVAFDMIAGLDDVKNTLRAQIIYPLKYPELLKRRRIKISKLLLIGPPGTGKTMIGKAVATEIQAPFFYIKAADIKSKFVGESENNVKRLFEEGRRHPPLCIIYIDEIESLIPRRDSSVHDHMGGTVSQFLAEMDGLNTNKQTSILLIGATNRPQDIDRAALRPGRFDNKILVPLPDTEARKQIFYLNLHDRFIANIDYSILAEQTEGFSGADIAGICNKVEDKLIIKDVEKRTSHPITMEILMDTIRSTTPSVSKSEMEWFRGFAHKQNERFLE